MTGRFAKVWWSGRVWQNPGGALSRRLWSLDDGRLAAEARRRSGLEDFGHPAVGPALSVLARSLEEEAQLHPFGRFLMRVHLRDLLETRLRLQQFWSRRDPPPGRIERPVFIVGMPRSGSTFLHELLAEHPGYRAPRVWEVMFPVPESGPELEDRARRIRQARGCLWWFRRLAPRADAVYPMRALTPHECVAIHSYTFLSQEFVSTCRVPRYETFLRGANLMPVYEWQKRFLQHLQGASPERRWVLKSPDHVYGLEALFGVFPDARIIQTHRNPAEVVDSSTELTRVLRGLYGPAGDPEQTRQREARILAEATERFIQFRDSHPGLAGRFIDVKYTELIAQPVATVRRIFEQLETPLGEGMALRVGCLAAHRSRYRQRRAGVAPAGRKLTTILETERFARYCSRFALSFNEIDLKK